MGGANMFYLMIRSAVLVIVTFLAAYQDWKHYKIPNELLAIGGAIGFAFSTSLEEVLYKALGIIFLYFFGMLRLMGMGDLKLWMVIVSFIRFTDSCIIIALAALFLIFYALIRDTKEARKVIHLSIWEITHLKKVQAFEQKGYAFAPFVFVTTILYVSTVIGRVMIH